MRGFDYDYTGVLWLSDLVWRGDRWRVSPDQVFESACKKTKSAAKVEMRHDPDGPATRQLLEEVERG